MQTLLETPLQDDSLFSPARLRELNYETPYLLMDLNQLKKRYFELSAALPNIQLHYAMKCNPDLRILQQLHSVGCQFEIASFPELEMLIKIGVDPQTVLFSNPVKPATHIAAAYQAGLRYFSFDSVAEIRKIAQHAPGAQVYVRLGIVDSSSEVASEGKFGVSPEQAIELMLEAKQAGLDACGIAFHVGSQMLSPEAWVAALKNCGSMMTILDQKGIHITFLDIGGGFPARYGNYNPDFNAFGEVILNAMAEHLPYRVRTVAEPGRALVAEAGVMVSTVEGLAERNGTQWAHLDVGAFNGMMEALETRNTLQFPVQDSRGGATRSYHLTGPSCDSQDTILYQVPLSQDLQMGDQVYIHSAGAYTTSYASNFNGFSIPNVHCV